MKRKQKAVHPGIGHRKRLRDRFLQAGLAGFLDYEVIELLLTLGTPRKDCKQLAKQTLKKFGSLSAVLDASLEELQEIKGIGPYNAFGIKLVQQMAERYAKEKIGKKIHLVTPEKIVNYLRAKLGHRKREHLLALYLNASNQLLKTKIISVGTLNENLIHPRELFAPALKIHAAQVIIAHNHPSGNYLPSQEDIKVTKMLLKAGKILGIKLTDHFIISRSGYTSFRQHGLL